MAYASLPRRNGAFTLIELLVVIAIIALLTGMVMSGMSRSGKGPMVEGAAQSLAATLRKTRSMAMLSGQMHGVAFHIQNEPGSSGRVLNNRSGGHWYRIIGPCRRGEGRLQASLPVVAPGFGGGGYWYAFPQVLENIKDSWIGEPQRLPAGKVRFLALSDTDEGPRRRGKDFTETHVWYPETYPRPWFGWFDDAKKTLHPWGGYDHGLRLTGQDYSYSGFYYDGEDGATAGGITGCRNPEKRSFDIHFAATLDSTMAQTLADAASNVDYNGDGAYDGPFEREKDYPIYSKGEPRPLINSEWLDVVIGFLPDGRAVMPEPFRNRRYYNNTAPDPVPPGDTRTAGVVDRTKTFGFKRDARVLEDYDVAEMVHFTRHTGGWYITLAPDSANDAYQFASAKEALESISPMVRVLVTTHGDVQVVRVKEDPSYLASRPYWPTSPDDWTKQTSDTTNPVWRWARYGDFASRYYTAYDPANTSIDAGNLGISLLNPIGAPITDRINTMMLTDKIWWLQ